MLVEVNMQDLTFVKVKGRVGDKKGVFTPFVQIDTTALAIINTDPSKYKGVLFNYTGRIQDITHYTLNKEGFEMVTFMQFTDLTELNTYMAYVPSFLTVVVQLPADYSDLRTLKGYCNMYPNVRFIGGKLLHIEGLRTGYVDKSFLNGRPKTGELVVEGLDPAFSLYSLEHIEEPEFIQAKEKTRTITEPKEKKPRKVNVTGQETEKKTKEPKEKKTKYDTSILFG